MDPDSHLISTAKEVLKCSQCHRYLSYFPVYTIGEDVDICGRCEAEVSERIRNSAYEKLAATVKFPCINDRDGCMEFNFPSKIPVHEKYCKFRVIECPYKVAQECDWSGNRSKVYEHFHNRHLTMILKKSKFEVNFVENSDKFYLLTYFEEFYLVNFKTDVKEMTCKCKLIYLGTNVSNDNYKFKITYQNVNQNVSKEYISQINGALNHKISDIMEALKQPLAVIVSLDIFKHDIPVPEEARDEVYDDLLEDLECPVCFLYMIPPILQCETGHSYCKSCTDSLTECPTCKKAFKQTQNFSLEKISRYVMYPCKNSDCSFKGKSNIIRQHEARCKYSEVKCPLNEYSDCKFTSSLNKVLPHLMDKHYENVIELENIVMPFDRDNFIDGFILNYDFQLFLMHLKYENNYFYWSLQTVGSNEEVKYNYDIDIIDCSGGKQRFYFSGQCCPLSPRTEAFTEDSQYTAVSLKQINKMVTDQFGFRITIYSV